MVNPNKVLGNILGKKPKKDFKSKNNVLNSLPNNNTPLKERLQQLKNEYPGDFVTVLEAGGDYNIFGPFTQRQEAKEVHDILIKNSYGMNFTVYVKQLL